MPITFTEVEANKLIHPYNDALVGKVKISDNTVLQVLIDNVSSADIMFISAFTKLRIGGAVLQLVQTPLYGFV